MPFTVSHVAAVLPLRLLRLPIAPLAIGSMVPDLPLFVPWWSYPFSHSLAGLASVDLAAGIVLSLAWWTVLRPPALDVLPARVRDRVPPRPRFGTALAATSVVGVLLGAATHLGWDEFTHDGRWGQRHIAWLAQDHLGVGGVHWAQAVSSGAGLVIVAVTAVRTARAAEVRSRPALLTGFATPAVGGIALVTVVAAGVAALRSSGDLHEAAFDAVTAAVPAGAAAALVAVTAWWLVSRRA